MSSVLRDLKRRRRTPDVGVVPRLADLARVTEPFAGRRRVVLAGCWVVIVAAGLVDHFSGTVIGLGPFYLVPVVAGAWLFGTSSGLQLAAAAAVAGFAADVAAFDGADVLIPVWNTFARLMTFFFVAWIVGRMRAALVEVQGVASTERERADELLEANEMKTTFLNAVSHELRTPLAAILGSARTLEELHSTLEDGTARRCCRRWSATPGSWTGWWRTSWTSTACTVASPRSTSPRPTWRSSC